MSRFQTRWTPEQRNAIREAATRFQLTATAIQDAARKGMLPGSGGHLEPFDMPISTVREFVTQARKRERLTDEATMDPAAAIQREAGIIAVELRRTREAMQRGKGTMTPEQITQLAKASKEALSLIRALDASSGATRARKAPDAPEGTPDRTVETPAPDFLDQLANGKH
jgi:hypothetical protein